MLYSAKLSVFIDKIYQNEFENQDFCKSWIEKADEYRVLIQLCPKTAIKNAVLTMGFERLSRSQKTRQDGEA